MTPPAPTPAPPPVAELLLPRPAREAMLQHARNCLPLECCGLFAVDSHRVRMVYPLTNSDRSKSRFTIEPAEQFGAMMHAERQGWQIGGVFHSHPSGPARLSDIDLSQPHDPDWVHVLISSPPEMRLSAWRISRARAVPVGLAEDPAV